MSEKKWNGPGFYMIDKCSIWNPETNNIVELDGVYTYVVPMELHEQEISERSETISTMTAERDEAIDENAKLKAEVGRFRELLAITYAGSFLYRDDGELQCNHGHPRIDFKRDSADDIQRKLNERHLQECDDGFHGVRVRFQGFKMTLDADGDPVCQKQSCQYYNEANNDHCDGEINGESAIATCSQYQPQPKEPDNAD